MRTQTKLGLAQGRHLWHTYDSRQRVDLSGRAGGLAAYGAGVATLVLISRRRSAPCPDEYSVKDVVLGGMAAHKFARLVSKSSIMSPLRAPFTEFDEPSGLGEVEESPRGEHGLQHTAGELLTCPFCVGVWVSTAYVAALVLAPRAARVWAAVFSIDFISDSLQLGYTALREL